jgi:hypothetical protein
MHRYRGYAERGDSIATSGVNSSDVALEVIPSATLTVYATGTTTALSLYSDDGVTPKANPFTASVDGSYEFWTADGACDLHVAKTGISSFTVPLGDPHLTGLSSTGIFDANAYGAVAYSTLAAAASGTDSASAFTACIAAAVTWAQANGGSVKVVYNPGIYRIHRACQTTNSAFAQIPLPKVAMASGRVYLILEPKVGSGNTIPFQGTGPGSGAMFYSTLTGQSYGASGWPAVLGGPDTINGVTVSDWSWITLHVRQTAFRQAANPTLCGINASLLIRCVLEDVRFDVDGVSGFPAAFTEPTNPTGVANLMPIGGTDGMSYRGLCEAAGYYGGLSIGELSDVSGQLFVYNCKVGLNINDGNWYHAPVISHAIVCRYQYGMATVHPVTGVQGPSGTQQPFTYRQHVRFEHISFEEDASGSTWARHKYHVYDPNQILTGYIGYHKVRAGEGSAVGPLTMLGGGYIETRDLAYPPPQRTIWQDTFTHTYAQEGNALSGRTPEKTLGSNWAVVTSFTDFKLVGSRLKADTSGSHRVWASLGTGNYNGTFEFSGAVVTNGRIGGIIGRVDDSNYVSVQVVESGKTLRLYERVAGVDTEQVSVSFADLVVDKDTLYQIIKDGNRIQVRADGGLLIDWTLSAGAIAAGIGTGIGIGLLVTAGQNSYFESARFLK